jgi:hypothetical protein
MERQIIIPRVGGRKNHGEDEKAREKKNTTCKLGRPVCLCEIQRQEGLQRVS